MTVEIFDKCQRVPNVDGEEEKGVAHNKLIVRKMGWKASLCALGDFHVFRKLNQFSQYSKLGLKWVKLSLDRLSTESNFL